MAQRTSTIVIDDLTGAELGADAVTMEFALEGIAYEIDLAPASAADLREALQTFIGAARKVGKTNRAGRGPLRRRHRPASSPPRGPGCSSRASTCRPVVGFRPSCSSAIGPDRPWQEWADQLDSDIRQIIRDNLS